ncbi:mitochondrial large subunit ribosomal protein-domain-containing protein [Hypoxylon sp. FL1857]|nr:mitochondrial large subunit ribosomal protein-domain-containing protein [Hypoxylon sp. FL1857]
MLLPRALRPIVAQPAPLSMPLTRLVLPIHTRCLTTTTTTTQSSEQPEQPSSSESVPPSSPEPASSSTTETQPQEKRQLPYYVGKNNLFNFGVYHKTKRGGNLKLTLLKNIEGDLHALKRDLKASLQLNDGEVSVNSVTRHIEIKGHRKMQVLNFIYNMGF